MTTTPAPRTEAPADDLARAANLIRRINLGDTLTRTASRTPSAVAVVDGDRRFDYRTLNEEVNRVANALAAEGYSRGDALALMSGNSLEFLLVYYACAKLGVVCVPINLGWRSAEIAYVLRHSGAKGAAVEAQLVPNLAAALAESPDVRDVVVLPGTGGAWEASPTDRRWRTLEQFCAGAAMTEPDAYVEDRDSITYLYTSGTTSAPKGVASSHAAVYVESLTAALEFHFTAADRTAAMMPLFHTAELNGIVTPLVIVGGTVVLMRAFEPATLLDLIESERITHVFGLPMMYRAMLDHPEVTTRDLSSLRRAMYAMAPMPDADLRRAIEVFDCEFCLGFGQTEMAPLTTVFQPEHQLTHTGSVGTPVVNVQVGVMDDRGNLLPWGESGEIVYRGPHAMEGYLENPEATREAFAHGWFHSGDVGHFDADGVLWFEDRKKDVIKTGGENVASIEVERALYAADARIQEVVVVGLPHPRWGEAITAVVTPRPGETLTEAEVLAAAREQLSGFKAPKAVIIEEDLPRTSTGKVQKNLLRDRYRDRFES